MKSIEQLSEELTFAIDQYVFDRIRNSWRQKESRDGLRKKIEEIFKEVKFK